MKNVVDAGSTEVRSSQFSNDKLSSEVLLPQAEIVAEDLVQIHAEVMETGSNDAEALLEALKSGRPLITPESHMFIDDEIQRVVSQVRCMEQENEQFEGDVNRLKFEIERTDSLEFTRNSGVADGDLDEHQVARVNTDQT